MEQEIREALEKTRWVLNKMAPTYLEWCLSQIADQQMLKEKAEKERDLLKEALTAVVEENKAERIKQKEWAESVEKETRQYMMERNALQEERDHLLAANDEYQTRLSFGEEEPPIAFKMDVNGNLTRI